MRKAKTNVSKDEIEKVVGELAEQEPDWGYTDPPYRFLRTLDSMIKEIDTGLKEDFEWRSKEEIVQVIGYLAREISKLSAHADDIWSISSDLNP